MTRVQIALARELWGWPIYTLIIAFGQVRDGSQFETPSSLMSFRCWLQTVIR